MDYVELSQTHCPVEIVARADEVGIFAPRPNTAIQKALGMGAGPDCLAGLIGRFAPKVQSAANSDFQRSLYFAAALHASSLSPEIKAMLHDLALRVEPTARTAEPYFEMLWANGFDLREALAQRMTPNWSDNANVRSNMAFYRQIYLLRLNDPDAPALLHEGLAVIAPDVTSLKAHLRYLVENVDHPKVRELLEPYKDDKRRPAGVTTLGDPLGQYVRQELGAL